MAGHVPEDVRQLAREVFLREAGGALVRQVAEILAASGIAIMPVKGVLLQKLVYGPDVFRSISDVDLLVPEGRFEEAHAALTDAGFETARWERGHWQAVLRHPAGPPLSVDLHRRLTRTSRARLTSSGLFERGRTDDRLFGASMRIPSPVDLFAHLLLHATLDWISLDHLHRPEDFGAVAAALSLDLGPCADHLAAQGLLAHALVMLPVVLEKISDGFVEALLGHVKTTADSRSRAAAQVIAVTHRRFAVDALPRRLAALTLAPSLPRALREAVQDRTEGRLVGGVGR